MDPKSFVSEVIDACNAVVGESRAAREKPNMLYHFTDIDGFLGIIASHKLWLSLATALNDAEEIGHGIKIAKAIVAERLIKALTSYDRALIDCINNPTGKHFGMSYESSQFVASFCDRCDKASQWLHYGHSGTGIALGFTVELEPVVSRDLMWIDYNKDSQKARMERLIDAGYHVLMRSGTPDDRMSKAAAHIVSIMMPALAVQMKHPSFEDEGEWRLVHHYVQCNRESLDSVPPDLKTRRRGATLVPYEEVSCGERLETLKEVVVGYSSPLGLDAVRLLLSEYHLNPHVRRSDVPVR